ncbi:hypothetical protein LDENG_00080110 [Lucifuga dentata]|nr:hypothetical protein LDENG_00080110 [Lucifuga dentata]
MKDNLILFAGQKGQGNDGDDFLVLGIRNSRVMHKFNLGSGVGTIVSDRLNRGINIHTLTFGRFKNTGWLKVDGQRTRTGSSPRPLVGLNVFNQLFVGGYKEYTPELLPLGSRFRQGFQGCIFDVQLRTRRDRKFRAVGVAAGHCRCPVGLKGALCSENVSVCDAEHSPPPLCAQGSTCIPLPSGYTCQCPLGTAGHYCEKGFVQLRYDLRDGTHILQSVDRVDTSGATWHTVKAGRTGNQGFLQLDGKEVVENGTEGMTTLDVEATEGEPVGFTGGLRELILNGHEFDLTERGALSGANVGDWDGTACGYKVCQNGGHCRATGINSFSCVCPPSWTGSVCNQSVSCVNNTCRHGSSCSV